MTGAQIPEGADAVVMIELTQAFEENGKSFMSLKRRFQTGDNISKQVRTLKKGVFY